MRKRIVAFGAVIALSGLVACNNQALDTRYTDRTRPIGYYSNENDMNGFQYGRYGTERLNGNVRQVRDNDEWNYGNARSWHGSNTNTASGSKF